MCQRAMAKAVLLRNIFVPAVRYCGHVQAYDERLGARGFTGHCSRDV